MISSHLLSAVAEARIADLRRRADRERLSRQVRRANRAGRGRHRRTPAADIADASVAADIPAAS